MLTMKSMRTLLLTVACLAGMGVRAEDLSPETTAKFLKVIITSSGGNKIACSDPTLKAALEAVGIVVDAGAPIGWASNAMEAKNFKTFGRLVITGKRDLAGSAAILIQEEGGRPKIILNPPNLKGAKVQISDAVLKMGSTI